MIPIWLHIYRIPNGVTSDRNSTSFPPLWYTYWKLDSNRQASLCWCWQHRIISYHMLVTKVYWYCNLQCPQGCTIDSGYPITNIFEFNTMSSDLNFLTLFRFTGSNLLTCKPKSCTMIYLHVKTNYGKILHSTFKINFDWFLAIKINRWCTSVQMIKHW